MKILKSQITERVKLRFFAKVDKNPITLSGGRHPCWVWTGSTDGACYGTFSLHGRGASPVKAHRLSYVIAKGEINGSDEVCHKCDNPWCVNPDHLFTGTHLENMTDAKTKGRMKVASKGKPGESNNSAKLTSDQVTIIKMMIRIGMSYTKIGLAFSVTRHSISNIARGRKWKTHAKLQ